MPRTNRPPSYRLHKARNCAVVTIGGKNFYLGAYGSSESLEKYARLISQVHADRGTPRTVPSASPAAQEGIAVNELILRYLEFASGYYRKNGESTGEFENIRCAVRPLKRLYGHSPAGQFKTKDLELVRQAMIDDGLGRKNINNRISRIRRMFRWGTKEGLVPGETYHSLTALDGLKRNRSGARETDPVTIVPDEVIKATLPFLSEHLRAMVTVQELTGMRPQDIRNLRTCDLEMSDSVWVYTPWTHKTEHHGHLRRIAIGPRAQGFLKDFLKRGEPKAYIFNPREAVEAIRASRRKARKTPLTPSERARRRKPRPQRAPREHYDKNAYQLAVARACKKAGVSPWSPNRLRHNCATRVRRLFGLEAAAAVLGHKLGTVTEIYAEADLMKAIEVMKEIG